MLVLWAASGVADTQNPLNLIGFYVFGIGVRVVGFHFAKNVLANLLGFVAKLHLSESPPSNGCNGAGPGYVDRFFDCFGDGSEPKCLNSFCSFSEAWSSLGCI